MVTTAIHAAVWSTDSAPDNVASVLERAATAGFDCLALPIRKPSDMNIAALARAVANSGITAIGTAGLASDKDISSDDTQIRQNGRQHLESVIQAARDLGMIQINGVLYGALGHAHAPIRQDAIARSAEVLAGLADIAERSGITLCLELVNRYETAMLNTVEQGLELLSLANHPNLRLHIDTFHMSIEERDAPAAARAALPHLGYFELDQSHRGRLDEGSLNLAAIAAPVLAGGYDGLVGVEAFSRSRLADEHANTLAIWRDHFDDSDALASHARKLIDVFFPPRSHLS